MPKTPIDYQNTFIYKLVHKDDLDDKNIYIGHTTNLRLRKTAHKSDCNNVNGRLYNINLYKFIRENGGWDCWNMLKVEDYPCKDVYEAKNRERYWIKELGAILNMTEPNRTLKEWYLDNKDYMVEKQRDYYNTNSVDIREKRKNNVIECPNCGSNITRSNLSTHQRSLKCLNAKKNNTE